MDPNHTEPADAAGDITGPTVSRYRITHKLGGGGMVIVYQAEDSRVQRFAGVKFVSADPAADPQALQRFRREARAASALNHLNICAIYDIGGGRRPSLSGHGAP